MMLSSYMGAGRCPDTDQASRTIRDIVETTISRPLTTKERKRVDDIKKILQECNDAVQGTEAGEDGSPSEEESGPLLGPTSIEFLAFAIEGVRKVMKGVERYSTILTLRRALDLRNYMLGDDEELFGASEEEVDTEPRVSEVGGSGPVPRKEVEGGPRKETLFISSAGGIKNDDHVQPDTESNYDDVNNIEQRKIDDEVKFDDLFSESGGESQDDTEFDHENMNNIEQRKNGPSVSAPEDLVNPDVESLGACDQQLDVGCGRSPIGAIGRDDDNITTDTTPATTDGKHPCASLRGKNVVGTLIGDLRTLRRRSHQPLME